jgi:hypothetical protein
MRHGWPDRDGDTDLSGPAGVDGSMPRMPRSSDSLSTVTSSDSNRTSSIAARIAISVAAQLAAAARNSQPGDGALADPPTDLDMSVVTASPSGPAVSTTSPSRSTARAAPSRYRASAGFAVRYSVAPANASLMVSPLIPTSSCIVRHRRSTAGRPAARVNRRPARPG